MDASCTARLDPMNPAAPVMMSIPIPLAHHGHDCLSLVGAGLSPSHIQATNNISRASQATLPGTPAPLYKLVHMHGLAPCIFCASRRTTGSWSFCWLFCPLLPGQGDRVSHGLPLLPSTLTIWSIRCMVSPQTPYGRRSTPMPCRHSYTRKAEHLTRVSLRCLSDRTTVSLTHQPPRLV